MAEERGQKPLTPEQLMALQTMSPERLAMGQTGMGVSNELEELRIQDLITEALSETSTAALVPNSGFDYSQDELPSFFPQALLDVLDNEDLDPSILQGVYDPYMGTPEPGDEQVYFGDKINADVFFGDMTGWGVENYLEQDDAQDASVNEGNRKQRGRNRAENLRNDRANKIEAQLGGDPAEQTTAGKGDRPKKSPNTMSYQQALNLPYLWDEEEVNNAMKKFREAGVNVTSFNRGEANLLSVWGSLVDRAAQTYSQSGGKRKVTPWDVLELSKREAMSAGNFTNFESGTQTQTHRSVAEISEGASWQVLQSTLSTLLGRDPTDEEVRDYTYRMNSLAAKNPSITETITRYQAGEQVSSNSNTTGGFDAGDMAQDAYEGAQDDPDYGAYQAATLYFNSAVQAVGAIGDV